MERISKKCPSCHTLSEFPKDMGGARPIICPHCGEESRFAKWYDDASLSDVAVRFSEGKLRFDLIPPEADKVLAEILTMGAKKYSDRNWEKGSFKWCKDIVGSLKRHLNAWELGQDCDEESKHNHIKHVMWNAMALCVYIERGLGEDDRVGKK